MYMMSLMAWLAAPTSSETDLNKEKCIKIALVHDIAECIVGDITPHDNISKEDKSKQESGALETLKSLLGGGDIANEIADLWLEYEHQTSNEAILIKQIDKLEMVIQAFVYEKSQSIDLSEFYDGIASKLSDPTLIAWFHELSRRRLESLPNLPPIKLPQPKESQ